MQALTLRNLNYVVFDLETTGLYADQGDEMIEIGAVHIDGCSLTQKVFQTFVNPGRPIPASATQIHGIKDSDVSSAPNFKSALQDFLQFAGSRIWVAQNAKFDLSFVVRKLHQLGIPLPQRIIVDTIGLSKILFPYETSHNLDVIMARLGIAKSGDRHRSLDDSRYTGLALIEFIKLLEQQNITGLHEIESAFVKPESVFKVEKPKTRSLFGGC